MGVNNLKLCCDINKLKQYIELNILKYSFNKYNNKNNNNIIIIIVRFPMYL